MPLCTLSFQNQRQQGTGKALAVPTPSRWDNRLMNIWYKAKLLEGDLWASSDQQLITSSLDTKDPFLKQILTVS